MDQIGRGEWTQQEVVQRRQSTRRNPRARIHLTMYRRQFCVDTVKLIDCQVKRSYRLSSIDATNKVMSEARET